LKGLSLFAMPVLAGVMVVAAAPSARAAVSTNFNNGPTDYTNNFTQNHDADPRTNIGFGATSGVQDQAGPANGGGLTATGPSIDTSVLFKNAKAQLTDGLAHSVSTFVTATPGMGSGDKQLQLGFIIGPNSSFNGENPGDVNNPNTQPTAFISARLLGDSHVEFQSKNIGSGTSTNSNLAPTGTINPGDWLKVTFTVTETNVATGAFNWAYTLEDYGPTGLVAPASPNATNSGTATISGLANTDAFTGFRTATPGAPFAGTLNFDNFDVAGNTVPVPEPATLGLMTLGLTALVARRRRH
jgi:hypothetical protein